jgi:hypothetical protein
VGFFQIRRYGRDIDMFKMLPNGEAGKSLKQAKSEAIGEVKVS